MDIENGCTDANCCNMPRVKEVIASDRRWLELLKITNVDGLCDKDLLQCMFLHFELYSKNATTVKNRPMKNGMTSIS